ncbi:MAG TPA: hypothetical protein VGO91_11910 [Pyrinomonadaceae bacterium]|jgi:hypothetical protein|nr:hypothetical protein [Pyrinomonadaceae bacterium]
MNPENHQHQPFESAAEIEILVQKFESCQLSLAEFKHRQHLTVALWYLSTSTEREAIERMCQGLQRFISHHGETGYHETITIFWLQVVRAFLAKPGTARPLPELANELLETHGNSRLINDYYSKDLISSEGARQTWVQPNIKPFDF